MRECLGSLCGDGCRGVVACLGLLVVDEPRQVRRCPDDGPVRLAEPRVRMDRVAWVPAPVLHAIGVMHGALSEPDADLVAADCLVEPPQRRVFGASWPWVPHGAPLKMHRSVGP